MGDRVNREAEKSLSQNMAEQERREVLTSLGGDADSVEQVLTYCNSPFERAQIPENLSFPLGDEAHLADWRDFLAAKGDDAFAFLAERIAQLSIPISEGVSDTDAYADVIRRGKKFDQAAFGGRLTIRRPDLFQFVIHEHPAGALPVFVTSDREDFENLDRALVFRNEPIAINPSVNAHLISGSINWHRVGNYRSTWTATHATAPGSSWGGEMKRVLAHEKWRFYDRFMLVCANHYSGVSAASLGLDMPESEWLKRSTTLRLEHEFMHYATKRLYDHMSLNLFDETICDWIGTVCALDAFKADWFLRFLGLEDRRSIRDDGRLHAYCAPLTGAALELLRVLMVRVADNLESLTSQYLEPDKRLQFALALTRLTLELLASERSHELFEPAYEEMTARVSTPR